eukprot:scaffold222128_cov32-Tisochrysis_lutea.AAC.3
MESTDIAHRRGAEVSHISSIAQPRSLLIDRPRVYCATSTSSVRHLLRYVGRFVDGAGAGANTAVALGRVEMGFHPPLLLPRAAWVLLPAR